MKQKLKCEVVTKEVAPEKVFKAMYGNVENFIRELKAEKGLKA